jgi:hypothetical protein
MTPVGTEISNDCPCTFPFNTKFYLEKGVREAVSIFPFYEALN